MFSLSNIETPVVSKAKMATSLLDMFKATGDGEGEGTEAGGFSLLDQFDNTAASTVKETQDSPQTGKISSCFC